MGERSVMAASTSSAPDGTTRSMAGSFAEDTQRPATRINLRYLIARSLPRTTTTGSPISRTRRVVVATRSFRASR